MNLEKEIKLYDLDLDYEARISLDDKPASFMMVAALNNDEEAILIENVDLSLTTVVGCNAKGKHIHYSIKDQDIIIKTKFKEEVRGKYATFGSKDVGSVLITSLENSAVMQIDLYGDTIIDHHSEPEKYLSFEDSNFTHLSIRDGIITNKLGFKGDKAYIIPKKNYASRGDNLVQRILEQTGFECEIKEEGIMHGIYSDMNNIDMKVINYGDKVRIEFKSDSIPQKDILNLVGGNSTDIDRAYINVKSIGMEKEISVEVRKFANALNYFRGLKEKF